MAFNNKKIHYTNIKNILSLFFYINLRIEYEIIAKKNHY